MLPRASVYYVKLILDSALVLVFVLSTSSMKQCKRKNIPNLGLKLCQLKCNENNVCLDYEYHIETLPCRLSRNESRKNEKQEGHMKLPRNLSNVQTGSCASETCRLAQRCLKTPPRKAICEQDKKRNNPRKQVDKQDSFANSELHIACRKGNFARVRRILSQGLIDINSRDEKHGRTPLMVAAKEGHCRIFKVLVTKGANMSQVDNDGKNILHWAYEGGHENMVGCVLPQLGVHIRDKRHPILQAALKGKRDVLEFLLCMGANINKVDSNDMNALHIACMAGRVSMVQYLLSQGRLDINGRGYKGVTPLMLSVRHGGYVKMVKYILSRGKVDVNRASGGFTPLMTAAYFGRVKIFDLLVRKGSHLVDGNGNNILHMAVSGGQLRMAKHILSKNMVDIKARNKNGETAAMIAKSFGKLRMYDLLVSWGCPVK